MMRAPVPASAADLSTPATWRRVKPFVVDIGANIGWFTINAAAAGGTVAAFEGVYSSLTAAGCWEVKLACILPTGAPYDSLLCW